jgi:uncharacterized 2Fe-2S/4Fe-4S cluster protein (DUF4445 family)
MERTIEVETADGRTHARSLRDTDSTIAEWLEAAQLPLNTRCGGRGLCRGCLVEANGHALRACQTKCEGISKISIPEASQRDHRINGVSHFEIGTHHYPLRPRDGIGLALDIGTTTVAAALWDLASGKCLASGSAANEQRRYGDNVLSRIDHAIALSGSSLQLQSALVVESLQPLIDRLCAQASIGASAVTESVAAGNTVMQHSLAGKSLSGFAAYPFEPDFLEAQTLEAATLGFDHQFPLTLAANLGPFVGADIAVGALASGMLDRPEPALLIDFGTNGEILLKTEKAYLATATAAGPAFEGGRLACGAAAGKGVISSLKRCDDKWQPSLIGSEGTTRATGISGAAYVDFLHCAMKAGIVNEMGRFQPNHPEVTTEIIEGESQKRTSLHARQYISETDIAELIQAKAAIAAGVMSLLEEAKLRPSDLATIYVAGGFGYHLNCEHAISIGMMPDVAPGRMHVIGNASLGGASLLLQSESKDAIHYLRENCRIIELNQLQSFEDSFIDCMPLKPIR